MKNKDIMLFNAHSAWPVKKLGQLFDERKQKVSDVDFPALSVTKNGIVPQLDSAAKTDDGDNRKLVLAGDYVINSRSDRKGSGGLSGLDGSVSLINIVLQPRGIYPRFAHHLLRSQAFQEEFYRWGHGIVADLWTTRFYDMKNIRLAVPDYETQKEIADFLDRETARIDLLIEKKQELLEQTSYRIRSLVDKAISDTNTPRVRFENATKRVYRKVDLSQHDELVRLGLYNRGRGIFKKPAADEEGMGDSDFFFVKSGDLILSGQFAWEGAVALATSDEEGCVVSHRYPVFQGKSGVNTAYLLGLLRSDFGDFLLNESSRGAAGRNRPLNSWRLGKEKIPVPAKELQQKVEHAINFEFELKKKVSYSLLKLDELRSSLITAAVTGQLDITTWQRRGQTERHLERLETKMAG